MNKRFITAFAVFSSLVFLFLIVWFVFRTINTRTENLVSARQGIEKISRTAASAYLSAGSFNSSHFSGNVTKAVDEDIRLEALVVTTGAGRVEFVYAAREQYLPPHGDFETGLTVPVSFSFNPITEEAVSTTAIIPSGGNIRLDAVYNVLERSEIFPIVKELLIGLLSFLLITAILIIVLPAVSAKAGRAVDARVARPEPPEKPAESLRFERRADGAPAAFHDRPRRPESEAAAPAVDTMSGDAVADAETASGAARGAVEELPADANSSNAEGLYSPLTELGWEQYLEERLSAELKRAASFDQDLVLLLGTVKGLKRFDRFYPELSRMAREFFNFQDLCFEYGDGGIGIIIPNVDIDQGIERVEGFKNKVDRRLAESGANGRIAAGLSARNGRLISGKRIIREAGSALRRACKDSGGIIAFRVDPEKYRTYIASHKSSIQR